VDQATRQALMTRLEQDARHLCARFGLRYRVLEAERANVKRRYGVCYSDGTIRIRLRHAATGRPLKYSSLVNTLCHELAHLRHFNHGPHFQAFYARILECARREGIYRPKAASAPSSSPSPSLGGGARPAFVTMGRSTSARRGGIGAPEGSLDAPNRIRKDGDRGGRGVPDRIPTARSTSIQLELFVAERN
jgi:hypothetical protein